MNPQFELIHLSELDFLFRQAIESAASSKFEEQSLLCLMQKNPQRKRAHEFVFAPHLNTILMIERNNFGQVYMVQDLDRSCHFTVPTDFHNCLGAKNYPLINNEHLQNITTTTNPVVSIIINKNYNFTSPDQSIVIINNKAANSAQDKKACLVDDLTRIVLSMFEDGDLAQAFTFVERKRSSNFVDPKSQTKSTSSHQTYSPNSFSTSNDDASMDSSSFSVGTISSTASRLRKRNRIARMDRIKKKSQKKAATASMNKKGIKLLTVLPTITLGWSVQDAHEYSRNKCTIAGNIKPCLRDGGISVKAKKSLLLCVTSVLAQMPPNTCFNVDGESDKIVRNLRKSMVAMLQEKLGGSAVFDSSFRIEGVTIIVPRSIGQHCDSLNCGSDHMNTVVSINVNIRFDNTTVPPSSKLRAWLLANKFTSSFPISILLYSRKCVLKLCQRMSDSFALGATDHLANILHWAMTKRTGSVCDYHGTIWCSSSFAKDFMKRSKAKTSSRFGGRLITRVEAYDKMVSACASIHHKN